MTEKPIIFNEQMVRAILNDWKTQTRRVGDKPRYEVGDRLWVRENIVWESYASEVYAVFEYEVDGHDVDVEIPEGYCPPRNTTYQHYDRGGQLWLNGLIPSIFMPKWAARIWLEVTRRRQERLQDITVEDCQAEGIEYKMGTEFYENAYIDAFRKLWDSINAKRGYPFAANPNVWVYDFSRNEQKGGR